MHRALLIDDLLTSILQHVTSPKDLINFARTCSAVSDPPLNMLWRVQSSLAPLIMCLPEATWEIRKDHHIYFTRKPLPMEWERVRINALRIRQFIRNNRRSLLTRLPKLDSHVVQQLFALFAPTELFPNLYALQFDAVSNRLQRSSDFWLLRQFFSPMLEKLIFNVPSTAPAHEVEQLVGALAAEASGLRQLSISVHYGGAVCHFALPLSLERIPKLNRLDMGAVGVCPAIHSIANIQHWRALKSLSLMLQEESGTMGNSASIDVPLKLSVLERLILYAGRLRLCTSFLLQIATPRLACLEVEYCTPAVPEEVTAFMLSLETCCQTFANMEQICFGHSFCCGPALHPLPSDVFRPLLKFTRLTYVDFLNMGNYCLDDTFIGDAAVAWPGIRMLRFIAEHQTDTPTVTFSAILSFATRCTSLRTLHLNFDATQVPTPPYVPGGHTDLWLNQTALRELHVGHSQVATAALVPFLLAVVFPNLNDIKWHQTPGVDYDAWLHELQWGELAEVWRKAVSLQKTNPAMLASFRAVLLRYMLGQVALADEDGDGEEEGILRYMLNGMEEEEGMGDSMSTS
ncbi:hypothetical protein BDR05DRAFT_959517 [Suillus weaverae]|nr:hypothetical protein BDR05DRAFT_959517 [Suillus weaverae]